MLHVHIECKKRDLKFRARAAWHLQIHKALLLLLT